MEDSLYSNILLFVSKGELPLAFASTKSNFLALTEHFEVNSAGRLERNGKVVVMKSELDDLWAQYHDHSGMNNAWNRIRKKWYFLGGQKWVREKTRDCVACAHKNNTVWPADRAPLEPITVVPKAFYRVHIDLLGPLKPISDNGNRYIAIAVDALTKFPEAMGNFHKVKITRHAFFCSSMKTPKLLDTFLKNLNPTNQNSPHPAERGSY